MAKVWTPWRRSVAGPCAGLLGMLLLAAAAAREPNVVTAAAALHPQPAPVLRLAGGLLTVNVRDVSLVELLGDLSRQAGFSLAPCAACDQRVSLRFDRLPLDQGLALILRDQNFALRWKGETGAVVLPQHLWLLPPAQGAKQASALTERVQAPVPVPPVAQAVAAAPAPSRQPSALSIGSPQERAEAAASMARGRQPGAVALLTQALADSDRQVRQTAIESLAEIGGAAAAGALALALRDSDARLREAAVNALGDVGGAQAMALLRQAQQDASPFVRRAASETLADLEVKRR